MVTIVDPDSKLVYMLTQPPYRYRLVGVGITHSDTTDTKVAVWITPRDTPDDSNEPSSEAVIAALDSKIKKSEFVVGLAKAISGG